MALGTLTVEAAKGATTLKVSAKPPAALEAAGQFRVIIGSEIFLVTAGQTTETWTVEPGREGSTEAAHPAGTEPIFHFLTAGALKTLLEEASLTDKKNPILNPSFVHEAEGTLPVGWGASGDYTNGGASVLRKELGVNETEGRNGGAHVVTAGTLVNEGAVTSRVIPVVKGVPFTVYFSLWGSSGSMALTAKFGSPAVGTVSVGLTVPYGEWTRYSVRLTPTATGVASFGVKTSGTTVSNFYIAAVSASEPYFDGDSPGCEWEGTPGNSVSRSKQESKQTTAATAYRSGAQKLGKAGWTHIEIDKVINDPGENVNTGTGVYTAPAEGFYLVTGIVVAVMPISTSFGTAVWANAGTQVIGGENDNVSKEGEWGRIVTGVVHCKKGDTLGLYAYNSGGTEPSLVLGSQNNLLGVVRVA